MTVQVLVVLPEKPSVHHQRSQAKRQLTKLKAEMGDGSSLKHPLRRSSKTVTFDKVTVYEFPRVQGFGSVPTDGGMTLGLGFKHVEEYTLAIHQNVDQPRLLHGGKEPDEIPSAFHAIMEDDMVPAYSTRCDSDKPKEVAVCSKNQSGLQKFGPLPWRRRRQLLLDSGVRRIDSSETKECRDIRASRERCGCECPGQCLREACSCSLNGIPCQVEKVPFPCACCEEACENPCGRRQYSPDIAHEHYRRTIARLEAEQAAAELPVSDPRLGEGKQDTKDECLSVLDGLSEDFKRACSLTESLPCGSH